MTGTDKGRRQDRIFYGCLAVIIVGLLVADAIRHPGTSFDQSCKERGGEVARLRHDLLCVKPGSILQVN